MSTPHEDEKEDRALDALISAALAHGNCENVTFGDLAACQKALTPEDRAALGRVPSNLVDRIIQGQMPTGAGDAIELAEEPLATAMNRGEETGELSDAARDEIEKKVREAQEKQAQRQKDANP